MTVEDLEQIEQELGITLPHDYRELMLTYPFAPDSFANDCDLPNDPRRLIDTNCDLRRDGFFGMEWPNHYFSMGGDGSGNEHFIDLRRNPSPVFLADHEGSLFTEAAPDLSAWVAGLQSEYARWEEEDRMRSERRRNKRWWQFWIR